MPELNQEKMNGVRNSKRHKLDLILAFGRFPAGYRLSAWGLAGTNRVLVSMARTPPETEADYRDGGYGIVSKRGYGVTVCRGSS